MAGSNRRKKNPRKLQVWNYQDQSIMVRKSGATRASRRAIASTPTVTTDRPVATVVTPFGTFDGSDKSITVKLTFCPQCKVTFNDSDNRPLQDCCGHVKCRSCFIRSEEGCPQCVEAARLRELAASRGLSSQTVTQSSNNMPQLLRMEEDLGSSNQRRSLRGAKKSHSHRDRGSPDITEHEVPGPSNGPLTNGISSSKNYCQPTIDFSTIQEITAPTLDPIYTSDLNCKPEFGLAEYPLSEDPLMNNDYSSRYPNNASSSYLGKSTNVIINCKKSWTDTNTSRRSCSSNDPLSISTPNRVSTLGTSSKGLITRAKLKEMPPDSTISTRQNLKRKSSKDSMTTSPATNNKIHRTSSSPKSKSPLSKKSESPSSSEKFRQKSNEKDEISVERPPKFFRLGPQDREEKKNAAIANTKLNKTAVQKKGADRPGSSKSKPGSSTPVKRPDHQSATPSTLAKEKPSRLSSLRSSTSFNKTPYQNGEKPSSSTPSRSSSSTKPNASISSSFKNVPEKPEPTLVNATGSYSSGVGRSPTKNKPTTPTPNLNYSKTLTKNDSPSFDSAKSSGQPAVSPESKAAVIYSPFKIKKPESHTDKSTVENEELNEPSSSSSNKVSTTKDSPPEVKKKKKRSPVLIHDHITILQGDPPMYQCNVCMKKFKTKAHIKYHEFCQNGEKPFKCDQCGQGFIAKSHFEYHLRTHTGERPYVCPKCGKGFNQRGKVTRHMRSHTGEKPFVCQQCGRGFANAQALRSHFLIHTGERPFACQYCNKRFTGMTNLKKHVITHTGERPFMCPHCGKSFGLKWTLDLHLRTHSSERPYACDQCTRAFSNSKDLRRHLVIHSGERPFKCWICGTAFRRKDNLDRHIKNTHNQPKEVAKQLANEAAAEYLALTKSKNSQQQQQQQTQNQQNANKITVVRTLPETVTSTVTPSLPVKIPIKAKPVERTTKPLPTINEEQVLEVPEPPSALSSPKGNEFTTTDSYILPNNQTDIPKGSLQFDYTIDSSKLEISCVDVGGLTELQPVPGGEFASLESINNLENSKAARHEEEASAAKSKSLELCKSDSEIAESILAAVNTLDAEADSWGSDTLQPIVGMKKEISVFSTNLEALVEERETEEHLVPKDRPEENEEQDVTVTVVYGPDGTTHFIADEDESKDSWDNKSDNEDRSTHVLGLPSEMSKTNEEENSSEISIDLDDRGSIEKVPEICSSPAETVNETTEETHKESVDDIRQEDRITSDTDFSREEESENEVNEKASNENSLKNDVSEVSDTEEGCADLDLPLEINTATVSSSKISKEIEDQTSVEKVPEISSLAVEHVNEVTEETSEGIVEETRHEKSISVDADYSGQEESANEINKIGDFENSMKADISTASVIEQESADLDLTPERSSAKEDNSSEIIKEIEDQSSVEKVSEISSLPIENVNETTEVTAKGTISEMENDKDNIVETEDNRVEESSNKIDRKASNEIGMKSDVSAVSVIEQESADLDLPSERNAATEDSSSEIINEIEDQSSVEKVSEISSLPIEHVDEETEETSEGSIEETKHEKCISVDTDYSGKEESANEVNEKASNENSLKNDVSVVPVKEKRFSSSYLDYDDGLDDISDDELPLDCEINNIDDPKPKKDVCEANNEESKRTKSYLNDVSIIISGSLSKLINTTNNFSTSKSLQSSSPIFKSINSLPVNGESTSSEHYSYFNEDSSSKLSDQDLSSKLSNEDSSSKLSLDDDDDDSSPKLYIDDSPSKMVNEDALEPFMNGDIDDTLEEGEIIVSETMSNERTKSPKEFSVGWEHDKDSDIMKKDEDRLTGSKHNNDDNTDTLNAEDILSPSPPDHNFTEESSIKTTVIDDLSLTIVPPLVIMENDDLEEGELMDDEDIRVTHAENSTKTVKSREIGQQTEFDPEFGEPLSLAMRGIVPGEHSRVISQSQEEFKEDVVSPDGSTHSERNVGTQFLCPILCLCKVDDQISVEKVPEISSLPIENVNETTEVTAKGTNSEMKNDKHNIVETEDNRVEESSNKINRKASNEISMKSDVSAVSVIEQGSVELDLHSEINTVREVCSQIIKEISIDMDDRVSIEKVPEICSSPAETVNETHKESVEDIRQEERITSDTDFSREEESENEVNEKVSNENSLKNNVSAVSNTEEGCADLDLPLEINTGTVSSSEISKEIEDQTSVEKVPEISSLAVEHVNEVTEETSEGITEETLQEKSISVDTDYSGQEESVNEINKKGDIKNSMKNDISNVSVIEQESADLDLPSESSTAKEDSSSEIIKEIEDQSSVEKVSEISSLPIENVNDTTEVTAKETISEMENDKHDIVETDDNRVEENSNKINRKASNEIGMKSDDSAVSVIEQGSVDLDLPSEINTVREVCSQIIKEISIDMDDRVSIEKVPEICSSPAETVNETTEETHKESVDDIRQEERITSDTDFSREEESENEMNEKAGNENSLKNDVSEVSDTEEVCADLDLPLEINTGTVSSSEISKEIEDQTSVEKVPEISSLAVEHVNEVTEETSEGIVEETRHEKSISVDTDYSGQEESANEINKKGDIENSMKNDISAVSVIEQESADLDLSSERSTAKEDSSSEIIKEIEGQSSVEKVSEISSLPIENVNETTEVTAKETISEMENDNDNIVETEDNRVEESSNKINRKASNEINMKSDVSAVSVIEQESADLDLPSEGNTAKEDSTSEIIKDFYIDMGDRVSIEKVPEICSSPAETINETTEETHKENVDDIRQEERITSDTDFSRVEESENEVNEKASNENILKNDVAAVSDTKERCADLDLPLEINTRTVNSSEISKEIKDQSSVEKVPEISSFSIKHVNEVTEKICKGSIKKMGRAKSISVDADYSRQEGRAKEMKKKANSVNRKKSIRRVSKISRVRCPVPTFRNKRSIGRRNVPVIKSVPTEKVNEITEGTPKERIRKVRVHAVRITSDTDFSRGKESPKKRKRKANSKISMKSVLSPVSVIDQRPTVPNLPSELKTAKEGSSSEILKEIQEKSSVEKKIAEKISVSREHVNEVAAEISKGSIEERKRAKSISLNTDYGGQEDSAPEINKKGNIETNLKNDVVPVKYLRQNEFVSSEAKTIVDIPKSVEENNRNISKSFSKVNIEDEGVVSGDNVICDFDFSGYFNTLVSREKRYGRVSPVNIPEVGKDPTVATISPLRRKRLREYYPSYKSPPRVREPELESPAPKRRRKVSESSTSTSITCASTSSYSIVPEVRSTERQDIRHRKRKPSAATVTVTAASSRENIVTLSSAYSYSSPLEDVRNRGLIYSQASTTSLNSTITSPSVSNQKYFLHPKMSEIPPGSDIPMGVQFVCDAEFACPINPANIHFVRPGEDQYNFISDKPFGDDVQVLYAAAAATMDPQEGNSGPPAKLRLLYAEAIGIQKPSGSTEGDQLQLYYAATTPNQDIGNDPNPSIRLDHARLINAEMGEGGAEINPQQGQQLHVIIAPPQPNYLANSIPVEVSYNGNTAVAQSVVRKDENISLISRARAMHHWYPSITSHPQYHLNQDYAPPLPSYQPQPYSLASINPIPCPSYTVGSNYASTNSEVTPNEMMPNNSKETNARSIEIQAESDAVARAAAAIAAVGQQARQQRQREMRERNFNRGSPHRGPRKQYLSKPPNFQD